MTRIVLHIDKLVLRGLDPDSGAVSAGVQAELQRLLAKPGAASSLAGGGDRFRIKAEPTRLIAEANGCSAGRRIAASIANGVKS